MKTVLSPMMMMVAITAVALVGMSVPTNAQQTPQQDQQQQEDKKQHKAQKDQQQQGQEQHNQQKAQQQEQRQQQRLSQQRQQELIGQQQQRLVEYRRHLEEQQRREQQQSAQLQQEKPIAQYRFQQQYLERLRQQQISIENERNYNYGGDPFFYTPPSYRYLRSGNYYETNQYGADLLRRSVNYGYEEGFRAGKADREDRWASSYRNSYAYQDANYGYNGFYVSRDDYNHYFREGFQRGYEDGYDSRHQYGSYSNGNYSILSDVLSAILNLESLR